MKTAFLLFLVLASGCTTIHFDNGEVESAAAPLEMWHHNYVFALVEGSAPVSLENECGEKDWVSVKTELTFINGLAGTVVNFLGPIWYPKTVEVQCK